VPTRTDGSRLALAIAIAAALTLVYFVATHGWTKLANPIPGMVAVLSGVIGFTVAALTDRRLRLSLVRKAQAERPATGQVQE